MKILPVQWQVLALADGTRDIEGVALAARARGIATEPTDLAGFLEHLDEKGLLAEGPLDAPDDAGEPDEDLLDVPVEAIAGWTLICSGRGVCCEAFSTVLFTPREARRALVVLDDELHDFYPSRGVPRDEGPVAPIMVHGRCGYLNDQRRCMLHARAGTTAKPSVCRSFPMQSVYDGATVRAAFTFECACVVDGIGVTHGDPPFPRGARTLREVSRLVPVARLPERVTLDGSTTAPRAGVRRFYRALAAATPPRDVAAGLWAIGGALASTGVDAAETAYATEPELDTARVREAFSELRAAVSAWRAPLATFRSEADFTRAGLDWIVAAADRIARSELPPAPPLGSRAAEVEAFYVTATSWGYADALGRVPLARAFRIRALRLWLARAIAAAPPDDPRAAEPLTVVEVLFRAVGLDSYAAGPSDGSP